jgi:3-dehydroquinate dehydratase-2
MNPAAYTHYSYALRDAVEACGLPAAEVHLSDISKREPFRRTSVIKPVCLRQFKGKGELSYIEALEFLAPIIKETKG